MIKRVSGTGGERIIDGVGVSAGFAIGVAHVVETGLGQLPEYKLNDADVDAEVERFRAALAKAQKQVGKLRQKTASMPESLAEELAPLLDAHAAMLGSSRMGAGTEAQIRKRKINAEAAVQAVVHEINEAFSGVTMAAIKEHGIDPETVNVHGGAVSLGHPIGCSGARVLVTLLHAMQQRDAETGMASLCLGGGNAVSLAVERV